MQRAAISAVIAALVSSAAACHTHATRVLDEGARRSAGRWELATAWRSPQRLASLHDLPLMHTRAMTTPWPLIATLGTHCGTPFDVLCAWLAHDGSVAWLFDQEGWLHRVDLRAHTRRSWRLFERGDSGKLSAQMAGVDRPFLWFCYGSSGIEECDARVFELTEQGAELRRTLTLPICAGPGLRDARSRCSAVLVRSEDAPLASLIYAPDGTLLSSPSGEVLAATARGYWAREGDRFEFFSHDGRSIDSQVIEDSEYVLNEGALDETTLVLAPVDELLRLDAEAKRVLRVKTRLALARSPTRRYSLRGSHLLHRSGVCGLRWGPEQPQSRFGVQRWDSDQIEPIPLGSDDLLQWFDERWILGTTRGHCSLYDRASGAFTTSDCPPVTSIAMSDVRRPIIVQHKGGLTRWWDARTESILAEDRSTHGTERRMLGFRQGSTRVLFIEEPRYREVTLVERMLVDGAAREVWSATIGANNESASVTAVGEDDVIVTLYATGPTYRAVLLSRERAIDLPLERNERIAGRLLRERGELVLEQVVESRSATNTLLLQRVRIAADGTRSVLDAHPLSVVGGFTGTNAGFIRVLGSFGEPMRVRFESRDGAITEYDWSSRRVQVDEFVRAREAQRVAAKAEHDDTTIFIVDAQQGQIARWQVIDEDDEITALAMSDDGTAVCVGTASGRVLVFCERDGG